MIRNKYYIYILLTLSLILLFLNLGANSLWDSDEALYTEISRELVNTQDWLTLHWNFKPWFCHPPLYMWLTAFASFLFGWCEFTARFWSAVFSASIIILVFFMARRFYSERIALWSGLILLTSLQFFIQARMAFLDIPFTFFITLSSYFSYLYMEDKKESYSNLFWVSCALGTLAKGPFALCLPLAIFFLYAAFTGNLRVFLKLIFNPFGITVYLIVGLSWYVAEYLIYGYQFYKEMFLFFTVDRIAKPILSQSGPFYYYLMVFLAGFYPWIAFFLFSFVYYIKRLNLREEKFLLIWFIFPFIFFTLVRTKLPNYIFVVYPAAVIMLARYFEDILKQINAEVHARGELFYGVVFYFVINFSFVLLFVLLSQKKFPVEYQQVYFKLLPLGLLTMLNSVAIFWCYVRCRPGIVYWIFAFTFAIYVLLVLTSPAIEPLKPMKNLAVKLKKIVREKDNVYIWSGIDSTNSFVYYLDLKREVFFISGFSNAKPSTKGRFFYLTNKNDFTEIKKIVNNPLYVIFEQGKKCIISNQIAN